MSGYYNESIEEWSLVKHSLMGIKCPYPGHLRDREELNALLQKVAQLGDSNISIMVGPETYTFNGDTDELMKLLPRRVRSIGIYSSAVSISICTTPGGTMINPLTEDNYQNASIVNYFVDVIDKNKRGYFIHALQRKLPRRLVSKFSRDAITRASRDQIDEKKFKSKIEITSAVIGLTGGLIGGLFSGLLS